MKDLLLPKHDWRTTDEPEILKRKIRAREESFAIRNTEREFPVHGTCDIASGGSGLNYTVEVRDVRSRQFSCSCADFRRNGLGTFKHVEAVLLQTVAKLGKPRFAAAAEVDSPRIELVVVGNSLKFSGRWNALPKSLRGVAGKDGTIAEEDAGAVIARMEKMRDAGAGEIRISRNVREWLAARARAEERIQLRRKYEQKVPSGEWPELETTVPLFPCQREGMLHLAFTERALLADEMGLGKTIQGMVACALLRRLGKAQRLLVVTAASLKAEWEEQIARFTPLPSRLVFGGRPDRLKAYRQPVYCSIVNYEQMIADSLYANAVLKPDIVVLDEAQRIKNRGTKTAQVIKRLESRYPFVLTGPPTENRICPKRDELEEILEEIRDNPDTRVIIFSEWERMLILVREKCDELGLGFAWHTGSVPQQKRRAEILAFKISPECRVFLSTDSGATGLKLQNASVVINCDLPWNPAKLEQRIARARRKHQTKPVTVINLVTEDSIEHRMIATLSAKQAIAGGVPDRAGELDEIKMRGNESTLAARLRQFLSPEPEKPEPPLPLEPVIFNRPQVFADHIRTAVGPALVTCEQRFPSAGEHSVLIAVVEGDARCWEPHLRSLHAGHYPPDKSDPLSPVHLEVIDRTTCDALERLIAADLIAPAHRVARPVVSQTSVS